MVHFHHSMMLSGIPKLAVALVTQQSRRPFCCNLVKFNHHRIFSNFRYYGWGLIISDILWLLIISLELAQTVTKMCSMLWEGKEVVQKLNSTETTIGPFSKLVCRDEVIRSMHGVHTALSVEPCISVWSLLKISLHFGGNLIPVDIDEVVAIRPNWC